jgi:hypothetical protein
MGKTIKKIGKMVGMQGAKLKFFWHIMSMEDETLPEGQWK